MRNTRVARRYALALMTAAEGQQAQETVAADISFLASLTRASRELRLLLTSPVVSIARKRAVLHELLKSRVHPMTLAFVELLTSKQREGLLRDIAEEFGVLRDERLGIVNVDVTSAVELTAEQQKALTQALEQHTKKKVRVNALLDPAVKGGLRIRIADTVVDATVSHKLQRLHQRFIQGAAVTH
jgi:F-type H+-transporting ATPase subunit delta